MYLKINIENEVVEDLNCPHCKTTLRESFIIKYTD